MTIIPIFFLFSKIILFLKILKMYFTGSKYKASFLFERSDFSEKLLNPKVPDKDKLKIPGNDKFKSPK